MTICCIIGSPRSDSLSAEAVLEAATHCREAGAAVTIIDLREEPLPLFSPDSYYAAEHYATIREKVCSADAFIVGTPDYHGSMSGTLKNFFDYFWHELAGRLFSVVCASHDKGITAAQHIATVVRQCYGWSLPYHVTVSSSSGIGSRGDIVIAEKIKMLALDTVFYGEALALRRHSDETERRSFSFMQKYYPKPQEEVSPKEA